MKSPKVDDLASHKLITIRWDEPMKKAARLMTKHRIRHLAVTDATGTVVGAISDRDVNRAKMPSRPGFIPDSEVCEFMNYPALSVPSDTPIDVAARNMLAKKVSALLVTDSVGRISGIITTDDLLGALIKILTRPGPLRRLSRSPLLQELLREAQSAGI